MFCVLNSLVLSIKKFSYGDVGIEFISSCTAKNKNAVGSQSGKIRSLSSKDGSGEENVT